MSCIRSFRPHPEEHRKSAVADLRVHLEGWAAPCFETRTPCAPQYEAGSAHHSRHGSRLIAILGSAFIRRFHSLMYSRMKASSVAGAVIMPLASVFTRPGMPKPRCI